MKRAGVILIIACLLGACLSFNAAATEPESITSIAAILMDADTGEVLYSKNIHKTMYPASITKILTASLVLEYCNTHEIVTVSASAANIPRGYSHIALKAGDEISVNDAMYAMMLPSANDAANALAEHVAGSQQDFATMMNFYAEEIGAHDSRFVNPSGIPSNNQFTTAYDMALITRAAIQNPDFMEYFGATSYVLPALNSQTSAKEITGYQYMLIEDKDEYNEYVIGGKIGYTRQAGHTMSTVAQKNGRTLICVVLGSTRDGKYADTQALLDYGFVPRLW